MNNKNEKILILDFMNMFIRNFSALSTINDNAEHVGGFFGTFQSIIAAIEKFRPTNVFCVWEGKGSGERRRKLLNDYKSGRKFGGFNRIFEATGQDERESFLQQIKDIKEVLDNLPLHQFNIEGMEADDVIAYFCTNLLTDKEKIIVTTDKDYFQLLDDKTTIFRPVRTKLDKTGQIVKAEQQEDVYNIVSYSFNGENIVASLPCAPKHYPLLKSFCGDNSDNIKGLKGVAEKTFIKLFPIICSYKSDQDIYTVKELFEYAKANNDAKNKYKIVLNNEISETVIENNYEIMQLLKHNIPTHSVNAIMANVDSQPRLNMMEFSKLLKKQNISTEKIIDWLDVFKKLSNRQREMA